MSISHKFDINLSLWNQIITLEKAINIITYMLKHYGPIIESYRLPLSDEELEILKELHAIFGSEASTKTPSNPINAQKNVALTPEEVEILTHISNTYFSNFNAVSGFSLNYATQAQTAVSIGPIAEIESDGSLKWLLFHMSNYYTEILNKMGVTDINTSESMIIYNDKSTKLALNLLKRTAERYMGSISDTAQMALKIITEKFTNDVVNSSTQRPKLCFLSRIDL